MNISIDQPPARLTLVNCQRIILLLVLLFAQKSGFAQSEPASVLTKNAYLSNPTQYLSKVNPKLIPSGILIDRVPFDDLILNVNGKDKVTTLAVNDWTRLHNELKYANSDTSYLSSLDRMKRIIGLYYEQDMTYPIGILAFDFNKVDQQAIDRGELVEGDDFLDARRAKASSFSKHRAVVASCLSHSIYGDNINFVVSNLLYETNIKDQVLKSVEVDFGNGERFREVGLSETVNVSYSSASEYIEIKTRLTYENVVTGKTEVYYAHSSVFRTGTSTVPIPETVSADENGRTYSTPIKLPEPIYYPARVTTTTTECIEKPGGQTCCCETFTTVSAKSSKITAHILFSPQNPSGKLRRPFIVTDGFDPGNKRDYYRTNIAIDSDLPRDNDTRGLFQLLNGDPSPWYSDKETTSPNLIASLRTDGYDVVIVNFLDGAGKIQDNVNALRGLFNNVLNGSTYRDNKTEEAILVGPSMGGVITRYMLRTMENAGEEPYVKTWISFDSPQQGAYIPIGLQYAIKSLERQIPASKGAALRKAQDNVNTTAAKQLLLYHYKTGLSSPPDPLHVQLYKELDNLGYPKLSKNYAITNGGEGKLYGQDKTQIIDFAGGLKVFGIKVIIAEFSAGSSTFTNGASYENAPGGWYGVLYSLNANPDNLNRKAETNTPYMKATFIPTTSAFGVKVTQSNVAKIWTSYKVSDTPFDVIRGMDGIGEEHVKISAATRNYLMGELHNDFDNTIRPRVRSGQVLNQTVKGKVALTSKVTTTFAGSGNSYTLESGADVVATAGNTIVMSPGFTAKAGSIFTAKITTINYSTVLRSATAQLSTQSVDYSQESPYTGAVYSYVGNDIVSEVLPDLFNYVIYPNPLDNFATIDLFGLEQKYAALQVYNSLGQLVYQSSIENGRNELDLSGLDQGIYFVKITYNGSSVKTSKLIKS